VVGLLGKASPLKDPKDKFVKTPEEHWVAECIGGERGGGVEIAGVLVIKIESVSNINYFLWLLICK
jgi:hypothetical protein